MQESDALRSGTYPVYGANGIVGYLDNYSTQDEAVYIIKDGSGVGTVSYVTGQCSTTGTLNTLQAKEGGNDAKSGWCRIGSNDQNCTILVICVS